MPRPPTMPPTRQYRYIEPEPRRGMRTVVIVLMLAGVAAAGAAVYLAFLRDRGASARSALEGFAPPCRAASAASALEGSAAPRSPGDDRGAPRAQSSPPLAVKALRANRAGLD